MVAAAPSGTCRAACPPGAVLSLLSPTSVKSTVAPGLTRKAGTSGDQPEASIRRSSNVTAQSTDASMPMPAEELPVTVNGPAFVRKTTCPSSQYQPGPAALPTSTPSIRRPVGT